MRIWPNFDVFGDAFENRAAKLVVGIDAMERGGELQVESRVIFGQHVLAVWFFAHLDL